MSQQLTTYEYIMNKRNRAMGEGMDWKGDGAARRRNFKLPGCMDWIIFCQCGRRRRSKKRSNPPSDPPKTATVLAGDTEETGLGALEEEHHSNLSDEEGEEARTYSKEAGCSTSNEACCGTSSKE